MKITPILAALALVSAAAAAPEKPMSLYDLTATTIDGKAESLGVFKGKVALVVNTASECGFTPQYEGLEKLYTSYEARGLVVLGFPSNDFGGQEPGTSEQIKSFCTKTYHVTFPMFEKVVTHGQGQSPVYAFLTASNPAPEWNFHKYVVGKDGRVRASFPSKVPPGDPKIAAAIEAALKE